MSVFGNTNAARKLTPDDYRLIREASEYRQNALDRLRAAREEAEERIRAINAEIVKISRELGPKALAKKFEVSDSAIDRIVYKPVDAHDG